MDISDKLGYQRAELQLPQSKQVACDPPIYGQLKVPRKYTSSLLFNCLLRRVVGSGAGTKVQGDMHH